MFVVSRDTEIFLRDSSYCGSCCFLFYHFDFQIGACKIVSLGCLSVGFHAALFAFAMSMPIITREFYLSFPSGNDFGKSHMDKNILTFSGGLM